MRELGLPGAASHESLERPLEGARCDAVILATPMWTHHAEATAALQAGKHVLCEKPLTTSMADALSLEATAERAGRVLMVDQNYRFRRPARAVRELVAGGALGELLSVRVLARRNTGTFWPPVISDTRYRTSTCSITASTTSTCCARSPGGTRAPSTAGAGACRPAPIATTRPGCR